MAKKLNVNAMLARVNSADADARDLAAAELTDLIEADYFSQAELERVATRFLRAAKRESDPWVKETMFNGLSEASIVGGGAAVDADAVAEMLDELSPDCLEHALIILGFSTNPKYKAKLKTYLAHADEDIRETAKASLAQIEYEEKPARRGPRIKRRA